MSALRYGGADALTLSLRLSAISEEEIVTCIVVYEEQMRGWMARSARAQTSDAWKLSYEALANNTKIYCGMNVLGFDDNAIGKFEELKKARLQIGTQDLKIASIALANEATVLTRNLRHFGKVPGLRVEDWTV